MDEHELGSNADAVGYRAGEASAATRRTRSEFGAFFTHPTIGSVSVLRERGEILD